MLASGFPPAAQYISRTVKFVDYLPDFGWTPVVLTAVAPPVEGGLAVRFGIEVVRTKRRRAPSEIARALRGASLPSSDAESTRGPAVTGSERSRALPLAKRVLQWFDTPDDFVGWIPGALRAALRMHRESPFSVVCASGPPFSVVVAGAIVSRRMRLPLVADFRDIWTLDSEDAFGVVGGKFRTRPSSARIRLLRALERRCLTQAAAILFTSRASRALYDRHYPEVADRTHLILNGFDPRDFEGPGESRGLPGIAHVGTLHDFQWPQVRLVLEAVIELVRADGLPNGIPLVFAGAIGASLRRRLESELGRLGLDRSAQILGFVPHREAIALMRSSRLLLAFAGTNPYFRLSKLSEYVAAGKPILCLAATGSESALDVERHGGTVFDPALEPASRLASSIAELVMRPAPGGNGQALDLRSHPLSRRSEAEALAEIFSSLRESAE